MTVQEFVNIDKDLQTVQDISDVNIIILIYLFIKHVFFILMYLHKCKMYVSRVETIWESLSFPLIILTSGFQCPSVYRQTTDCTEGGSLTREHYSQMGRHLWIIYLYYRVSNRNKCYWTRINVCFIFNIMFKFIYSAPSLNCHLLCSR